MRVKLEDYIQMEALYNQNKKEYELVRLKYEEAQEKEKLLIEKFRALDGIVQSKIEKNSDKWSSMIAEKLASEDIYTKSSCKMFKHFVKSLGKENISSNQP